MNHRVTALLLTALLLATTCACSPEAPVININPISGSSVTIPVELPTRPAPGTRMTLSDLLGEMGETMRWSNLENYEHTSPNDTTAVFPVSYDKRLEAELLVTYDAEADVLTQATLSYGDVSISILTDDAMVIRKIMLAMDEG